MLFHVHPFVILYLSCCTWDRGGLQILHGFDWAHHLLFSPSRPVLKASRQRVGLPTCPSPHCCRATTGPCGSSWNNDPSCSSYMNTLGDFASQSSLYAEWASCWVSSSTTQIFTRLENPATSQWSSCSIAVFLCWATTGAFVMERAGPNTFDLCVGLTWHHLTHTEPLSLVLGCCCYWNSVTIPDSEILMLSPRQIFSSFFSGSVQLVFTQGESWLTESGAPRSSQPLVFFVLQSSVWQLSETCSSPEDLAAGGDQTDSGLALSAGDAFDGAVHLFHSVSYGPDWFTLCTSRDPGGYFGWCRPV